MSLTCVTVLYAMEPLAEPEKTEHPQFAKPGTPYYDPCLEEVHDLGKFSYDTILQKKNCKYHTLGYLATYLDMLDGGTRYGKYGNFSMGPIKDAEELRRLLKVSDYLSPAPNIQFHTYLKNAAAFLGENWVYGQKLTRLDWGSSIKQLSIDGGVLCESVWFIMGILSETNNAYNFNIQDYVDGKAWNPLKQKLLEIVASERLLLSNSLNRLSAASFLANYVAGVLKVNEEWVFPAFAAAPYGGHVMLISMLKTSPTTVDMKVYNTGDGINYHPTMKGHKHLRYSNTLCFRDLNLEKDLLGTCFFDTVVAMSTGLAKGEDYGAGYFYNNILSLFNEKIDTELSRNSLDYSVPQRSGNCYQKVILAYIKDKLGHDVYKPLERAMKAAVVDYLAQKEFNKKGLFQSEVLLRGVTNEIRTNLRLYSRGLRSESEFLTTLSKLKSYHDSLQNHMQPLPSNENNIIMLSDENAKGILFQSLFETPMDLNDNISAVSATPEFVNAEDDPIIIIQKSKAFSDFASVKDVGHGPYFCFSFMLSLPLPSASKNDIYETFTDEQLDTFSEQIFKISSKITEHGNAALSAITAIKLVSIVWRFLGKRNQELAISKLDLRVFELIRHSSFALFYTPYLYQEYLNCVEYLKQTTNQDSDHPRLFSDLKDGNGSQFNFMSLDSAEYKYLKQISETNDLSDYLMELSNAQDSSSSYSYSYRTNECKSILVGESLKIAYLYMMRTPLVPRELDVLRELILYIGKLSTRQKDPSIHARTYGTSPLKLDLLTERRNSSFYDYFNCSSGTASASTVRLAGHATISGPELDQYNIYIENVAVIDHKQFGPTIDMDMDLLVLEPRGSKIYFALSCLSDYADKIFQNEKFFSVLTDAFFQGTALLNLKQNDPLNGPLVIKKVLEASYSKIKKVSILTGNEKPLQRYLDLEHMICRWLDIDLERPFCMAQLIGTDELLNKIHIGPKPVYIKEAIAQKMANGYPEEFMNKLLNYKQMQAILSKFRIDESKVKFEYPILTFVADGTSFVYNYWTDELREKKSDQLSIGNLNVIKDLKHYAKIKEDLDLVGRTEVHGVQLFSRSVSRNRRGIFTVLDGHYCYLTKLEKDPCKNLLLNRYKADGKEHFVFNFDFSLPDKIAGRTFLKAWMMSSEYRFSDEHGTWKVESTPTVPNWLRSFAEYRTVLPLVNVINAQQLKFVIFNSFIMNGRTIDITANGSLYTFNSWTILTDHPIMKKYQGCIVLKTSDDNMHALLPLSRSLNSSENRPYQLIKIDAEEFRPGKRKNQLKLTLFFVIHGYYSEALQQLKSMIITSRMTEYENTLLLKIAQENVGDASNCRPEMAAVAYYALYLQFVSKFNPEAPKPDSVSDCDKKNFSEFFTVKNDQLSKVATNYYDGIGRMPASFVLTEANGRSGIDRSNSLISEYYEKRLLESYGLAEYILAKQPGDTWIIPVKNGPLIACNYYFDPYVEHAYFNAVHPLDKLMDLRGNEDILNLGKDGFQFKFRDLITAMALEAGDTVKRYVRSIVQSQKFGKPDQFTTLQFLLLSAAIKPEYNSAIQNMVSQKVLDRKFEELMIAEIATFYPNLNAIEGFKITNLSNKASIFTFKKPNMKVTSKDLEQAERIAFTSFCLSKFELLADVKLKSEKGIESENQAFFDKIAGILLGNPVINRKLGPGDLDKERNEMNQKLKELKCEDVLFDCSQDGLLQLQNKLTEAKSLFAEKADATLKSFRSTVSTARDELKLNYEAALLSELYKSANIEELFRAYLTRDTEAYEERLPHISFEAEKVEEQDRTYKVSTIFKIHQAIHEYLLNIIQARRMERAIKELEALMSDGGAKNYIKFLEELADEETDVSMIPMTYLMEYHLGFRIRPKNIANISKMVGLGDIAGLRQIVLQSIMGSGKTEVISPALSFLKADGKHLAIFCPPSTHFETNVEKLCLYCRRFF